MAQRRMIKQGETKMGTISEEILSAHVGKEVKAGDMCVVPVDFMMSQDGTTGLTIKAFKRDGGQKVMDPSKVRHRHRPQRPHRPWRAVSNIHKEMREFADKQGVEALRRRRGRVPHSCSRSRAGCCPGMSSSAADSHTCTYGALNVVRHRRRLDRHGGRADQRQDVVQGARAPSSSSTTGSCRTASTPRTSSCTWSGR